MQKDKSLRPRAFFHPDHTAYGLKAALVEKESGLYNEALFFSLLDTNVTMIYIYIYKKKVSIKQTVSSFQGVT